MLRINLMHMLIYWKWHYRGMGRVDLLQMQLWRKFQCRGMWKISLLQIPQKWHTGIMWKINYMQMQMCQQYSWMMLILNLLQIQIPRKHLYLKMMPKINHMHKKMYQKWQYKEAESWGSICWRCECWYISFEYLISAVSLLSF